MLTVKVVEVQVMSASASFHVCPRCYPCLTQPCSTSSPDRLIAWPNLTQAMSPFSLESTRRFQIKVSWGHKTYWGMGLDKE